MLSGSWDKTITVCVLHGTIELSNFGVTLLLTGIAQEWDLNNGSIIRQYDGHSSQISSLSFCPVSAVALQPIQPLPVEAQPSKDEMEELFGKSPGENDDKADQMETSEPKPGESEQPESVQSSKHDGNVILTTSIDGNCFIWDRRLASKPARKLSVPEKTPPWCLSVSGLCASNERFVCESCLEFDSLFAYSRVGARMEQRFTLAEETAQVRHLICKAGRNSTARIYLLQQLPCMQWTNTISLWKSTSDRSECQPTRVPYLM